MNEQFFFTAREVAELTGKTKQAVMKRASKEEWPYQNGNGKGGSMKKYTLHALPSDIQTVIIEKKGISLSMIQVLSPEAALKAADKLLPVTSLSEQFPANGNSKHAIKSTWTGETAISQDVIRDRRVQEIAKITQEALEVPRGWKKRQWVDAVAEKHGITFQSVYRYLKRYEKKGLVGLKHTKSTREKPKNWSSDAIDFWVGLVLKKEHRKIAKDALYELLCVEADKRGWHIGGYASALWWLKKKLNPQLLALQRGGLRALDNTLPPVIRDYSDLAPFEILVGDQHRFDFWVVDDDSGEVFRPEGYLWQDLRRRTIYGAAIDRRYDAWLIGLALRIGIRAYGPFGSIYTDNGKPEISRYMMGIMSDMRALGLSWETTVDVPLNLADAEPEEISPWITLPGTHRRAIVKNAKAKMIESTFNVIEGIMRDHFRLPGYVKRLAADIHEQDVDMEEVNALARAGKLPLFSEFMIAAYRALDFYNREKAHRGVLKEWGWKPAPKSATPYDCLRACYLEGWRPRAISEEAADLIFLARESRVVNLGRIQFRNDLYEHDALITLNKQKVDIRYNPMDTECILVFHRGRYVCTAALAEYSSMKDLDLAERKIREKRERRRRFLAEYRRLTSSVPDFREYSKVPEIEKVAALVGEEKRRKALEQKEIYRKRTPEELEAEVARLETSGHLPPKSPRPLPSRPSYFLTDHDRYGWCVKYEIAGGTLSDEDLKWKKEQESRMNASQLEYWQTVREYGAL